MNHPTRNYDYDRAGVAMLTLKANPGIWLCRITPETFTLSPTGKLVQQALLGIPSFYAQIKIGQYLARLCVRLALHLALREARAAGGHSGGRPRHSPHAPLFREHYKPAGRLFDLCSQGRLLELSVAGAFPRFARLDRAACLRLNEVAGDVATTQWSQPRG